MLSTMQNDLKVINGVGMIVPKEYPNWHGIPNIGFVWHGEWSDPEIEYKGKRINAYIVEDAMWEEWTHDYDGNYLPNNAHDYDGFSDYMKINADEVYDLIELATRIIK